MLRIVVNEDETMVTVYIHKAGGIEELHFNYLDELQIDRDNINECFIEQSGKYAWWGTIYEQAKADVEKAKAELEEAEAEADEMVREQLELEGMKVTEALVNRKIKTVGVYKEKLSLLLLCKRQLGILDKVLKAFEQRMEALISIGANARKEFQSQDISIKQDIARRIINGN